MLITRKSPLTGENNTFEINVTQDQIDLWQSGVLIQNAMPNLSSDECEFIKTGYTAQDWEAMFGNDEDKD